ncbi:unnamed protein product [Discosporangium mesarthrocarpum]
MGVGAIALLGKQRCAVSGREDLISTPLRWLGARPTSACSAAAAAVVGLPRVDDPVLGPGEGCGEDNEPTTSSHLDIVSAEVSFQAGGWARNKQHPPPAVDVRLTLSVGMPASTAFFGDPVALAGVSHALHMGAGAGAGDAVAVIAAAAASNLALESLSRDLSSIRVSVVAAFGGQGAWFHPEPTVITLEPKGRSHNSEPRAAGVSATGTGVSFSSTPPLVLTGDVRWHPGAMWWLLDGPVVAEVSLLPNESTCSSKLLGQMTLCKRGEGNGEGPTLYAGTAAMAATTVALAPSGNENEPRRETRPRPPPSDPWCLYEEDNPEDDGKSWWRSVPLRRMEGWVPKPRGRRRSTQTHQQTGHETRPGHGGQRDSAESEQEPQRSRRFGPWGGRVREYDEGEGLWGGIRHVVGAFQRLLSQILFGVTGWQQ